MRSRLIVAGIGVPVIFVILFFLPTFATGILVAAICGLSAWELTQAVKAGLNLRFRIYPTAAAALTPIFVSVGWDALGTFAVPLVLMTVMFCELIVAYEKDTPVSFRVVAMIMVAGAVIPGLLTSIVMLRFCDAFKGRLFVLIPIIAAFISDAGAYFSGIYLGKKHIFPKVSPKKTLEGCLGGIVASIVFMMIYGVILNLCGYNVMILRMIIYGLAGALFSEVGDLAFSVIKRQYGVKDYGTILREHGGMLDRFDSMIFAAPAIYVLVLVLPAF